MLLGVGPQGPVPGRRVVVTGMGAVTCCGVGIEALWEQLCQPTIQGERRVENFDPSLWVGPKEARRLDRYAQFSVASASMALEDAGNLEVDPAKAGVVFATGVGGFTTIQDQVLVFHERGAKRVSPFLVPMMMSNAGAAHISMRAGWRGPSECVVTACAAGSHSVAAAARLVATGRCDASIGGGSEGSLIPIAVAAFENMTALSRSGNSCPFDARRDGFMMAEGAAALVFEERERAIARGATIYAEIVGAASTADAYDIVAPLPSGDGAVACMELALADAQLEPSDIGQINAHGTSTPLNDQAEAGAINKVFGTPGPPVTSNKGVLGHGLGAAGAIEAVGSVLSIHHRMIPPTAGYEQPDPEIHIDVVHGEPRSWDPKPVLSNSFGFGGHNGCLVFTPPS